MEWRTQTDVVDTCPYKIKKVIIPLSVKEKVIYLCRKTTTEFFIYLCGKIKKTIAIVKDFYLPCQEATLSSVEIKEIVKLNNIIGTLHKHPLTAEPHFSPVDDMYNNYTVRIVVNEQGDCWQVEARTKTKCGCFIKSYPEIVFIVDKKETKELKNLIREKIKEKNFLNYLLIEKGV